MKAPKKITIKQVVDAMMDANTPLHPSYLYRLSDLDTPDLAVIKKAWSDIPAWRRQEIMEAVVDLGEDDYVLSFEAFARQGSQDDEARIRELSVRALWEYESPDLVPDFIQILRSDPDAEVRAVAATALGKYVFLGEIEELPVTTLRAIEDELLLVTRSSDTTLVRRRALESLGYSSRGEVPPLIDEAYYSGSTEWLVSALFAMGVSANKDWNPLVLSQLDSDNVEVLQEAIKAAGELEIHESVARLIDLLSSDDSDLRMASAWSLSQIGGEGVREALENLYEEVEDDEEADYIESALENLDFTEDVALFDLMDVDEEGEDEEFDDELIDLDSQEGN